MQYHSGGLSIKEMIIQSTSVRKNLEKGRNYNRTPLIQINWDGQQPDMQKIRIIGFFYCTCRILRTQSLTIHKSV